MSATKRVMGVDVCVQVVGQLKVLNGVEGWSPVVRDVVQFSLH